jgi:hypothetical protein
MKGKRTELPIITTYYPVSGGERFCLLAPLWNWRVFCVTGVVLFRLVSMWLGVSVQQFETSCILLFRLHDCIFLDALSA